MNISYGTIFCNLAYEALIREEHELGILMSDNPSARPLGIALCGETTLGHLITKEAMRNPKYPQIIGEMSYQESRDKVDLCFVNQDECPIASFELKLFAPPISAYWSGVRHDIRKHLNPNNKIKMAVASCERYNVLFVTTDEKDSDDEIEKTLKEGVADLISDPTFIATSELIGLNRIFTQKRHRNPFTERWNYLRVAVFTGVCS
jgi:hypothetical protein